MKTLILTTTLIASVLASALSASAATRHEQTARFDGAKFFAEQTNRSAW